MIHYITSNGIGNAWVAAELRILGDAGVPYRLHSMRRPHQDFYGDEWARTIDRNTACIYPIGLLAFVGAVMAAPFTFRVRFFRALWNALFSERESWRARIACLFHLFVACRWARDLRKQDVSLIHSQWIQSGGTIGWYAAWLLDKPFSFTGHACDLFRDRSALKDKIKAADLIVAISEFHRDFYLEEGATPNQICIVYCGIDVDQFAFEPTPPSSTPRILSFGRLVQKKGFDTLIDACAILKSRGIDFTCEIAGNGPEEETLRRQRDELELQGEVAITGKPLLQEEVADWLHHGHIFAQPCRWSDDNDVDGIPRSLMEAMACGLPCVASRIAGLPDLVLHEETGLLVEPEDSDALANALQRLIESAELSQSLARDGRTRIEEVFNLSTCLNPLIDKFQKYLPTSTASGSPECSVSDNSAMAMAKS